MLQVESNCLCFILIDGILITLVECLDFASIWDTYIHLQTCLIINKHLVWL